MYLILIENLKKITTNCGPSLDEDDINKANQRHKARPLISKKIITNIKFITTNNLWKGF